MKKLLQNKPVFYTLMAGGLLVLTAKQMIENSIKKWSNIYGVDPLLVKAIIQVESSFNPFAVSKAECYGLMQVLFQDDGTGKAKNKFYIDGWPVVSKYALFYPDINIKLGVQILAWNIKTYGTRKGIAVYNSWSTRNESEPFSNQVYLNKVESAYLGFGGLYV